MTHKIIFCCKSDTIACFAWGFAQISVFPGGQRLHLITPKSVSARWMIKAGGMNVKQMENRLNYVEMCRNRTDAFAARAILHINTAGYTSRDTRFCSPITYL